MNKLDRVLRGVAALAALLQIYAFVSRYTGETLLSLEQLHLYFVRLPNAAEMTFGQALAQTASTNAFVVCCLLVFLETSQLQSQEHIAKRLIRGLVVAIAFTALSM